MLCNLTFLHSLVYSPRRRTAGGTPLCRDFNRWYVRTTRYGLHVNESGQTPINLLLARERNIHPVYFVGAGGYGVESVRAIEDGAGTAGD